MNKIFNSAVFMPGEFIARVQKMNFLLVFSAHAKSALLDDRYGTLPPGSLSRDFRGRDWQLVEVETVTVPEFSGPSVEKIVVRRDVDATRSLVLVIYPGTGKVATCWVNLTTDTHRTLDKSKFSSNL